MSMNFQKKNQSLLTFSHILRFRNQTTTTPTLQILTNATDSTTSPTLTYETMTSGNYLIYKAFSPEMLVIWK